MQRTHICLHGRLTGYDVKHVVRKGQTNPTYVCARKIFSPSIYATVRLQRGVLQRSASTCHVLRCWERGPRKHTAKSHHDGLCWRQPGPADTGGAQADDGAAQGCRLGRDVWRCLNHLQLCEGTRHACSALQAYRTYRAALGKKYSRRNDHHVDIFIVQKRKSALCLVRTDERLQAEAAAEFPVTRVDASGGSRHT